MTERPNDMPHGPRPDTPGFLVFLVVAALVGAAFLVGVRFLARWVETGSPSPGP